MVVREIQEKRMELRKGREGKEGDRERSERQREIKTVTKPKNQEWCLFQWAGGCLLRVLYDQGIDGLEK